jgi:hypothetical protein
MAKAGGEGKRKRRQSAVNGWYSDKSAEHSSAISCGLANVIGRPAQPFDAPKTDAEGPGGAIDAFSPSADSRKASTIGSLGCTAI